MASSGLRRSIELCVGSLEGMRTDTRGLLEAGTEVAKLGWEDAGDKEGWFDMRYYILHQVSSVHTQAVIDTLGIDGDRVVRASRNTATWVRLPSRSRSPVCSLLEPGDGVMFQGMGSGINAAIVEISGEAKSQASRPRPAADLDGWDARCVLSTP